MLSHKIVAKVFAAFTVLIFTSVSQAQNPQDTAISRIFKGNGVASPNLNSPIPPRVINQSNRAMEAITKTRFCVKSYTSIFKIFSGKEIDLSNANAAQIAQYKTAYDTYLNDPLLASHNKFQAKLFGEFFYTQKLLEAGRYQEAERQIAALKRNPGWTKTYLSDNTVEQIEKSTYLRSSTLQKLIQLHEFEAKLNGSLRKTALDPVIDTKKSGGVLNLFIEYLDNKPAFDSVNYIVEGYSNSRQFTARLSEFARDIADLKVWERKSYLEKIPAIVGFSKTGSQIDLYFGNKRIYLLRIDELTGKTTIFTEKEAARIFQDYCKKEVANNSTSEMTLTNVVPLDGGYVLSFKEGDIRLTRAEFLKLKAGQPLAEAHPLSQKLKAGKSPVVVWSNPLMEKAGNTLNQVESFVHALQKNYPESAIYRDDFNKEQTEEKVKALRSFKINGPDDLVAVIDQNSLVQDDNVINNIREELTMAKIKVVNYKPGIKWSGDRKKGLIVITGHINKDMANFIRNLGNDGYLKDNYVLFNSCQSPLTTELITEMNNRFGAIAVLQHEGKIRPVDVENFLADFSEKINQGRDFWSLTLESLHQNKLSATWVICFYKSPYEKLLEQFRESSTINISLDEVAGE